MLSPLTTISFIVASTNQSRLILKAWTEIEPMPRGLLCQGAVRLDDGRVILVGAESVNVYDPQVGHWSSSIVPPSMMDFTLSPLPNRRALLIVDGFKGAESAYLIDPDKLAITSVRRLAGR